MKNVINLRSLKPRKELLIIFSLFIMLLISPFVFDGVSLFASGAPTIPVNDETSLRNAVSTATEPTIIALTADIQLVGSPLTIPAGSHITLTNADDTGPWKLFGANNQNTITVNGELVLDGLNITHTGNGRGITVNSEGIFTMISGIISGNTLPYANGGGVYNAGVFDMQGGMIINNTITGNSLSGGGVYNIGDFVVSGANCVIANNTAAVYSSGGGVYNAHNFVVSGANCVIANNTATSGGGGVYNVGSFVVSGANCVIANNTAGLYGYGGGVYNDYIVTGPYVRFTMSNDCVIANNTAVDGGGVHNNARSIFEMFDGIIANNTASNEGGGVRNWGNFTMKGGLIFNNTANNGGGGVNHQLNYDAGNIEFGFFTLINGVIANNTARGSLGGGGIRISFSGDIRSGGFTMFNGVVVNNTALYSGGGVSNNYGNFTMFDGIIANNTANSNGGGVYQNRANFVLNGGVISTNTANFGGGVFSNGVAATFSNFTMSEGVIDNNTANTDGGGVYSWYSNFVLNGGVISNNTASNIGGGVFNREGTFRLSGSLFNNTASFGGGVLTYGANALFVMSTGVIANNTAADGGGVYLYSGRVDVFGGVIANNTAINNGGGIWVTNSNTDLDRLYVAEGVNFSDNRAAEAYGRHEDDDDVYFAQIKSTSWTMPFTQGYNNYDISYTAGELLTLRSVIIHDSYAVTSGAGNYIVGTTVTVNAGTRDDYFFSGWTVNAGDIVLSNSATETFLMPDHDVEITANWLPIPQVQYVISYVLNGGVNAAGNPASYSERDTFPIAIVDPSRVGYDFLGWTVRYDNGSSVTIPVRSYIIPAGTTGDITLTALWLKTDIEETKYYYTTTSKTLDTVF